MDTRFWHGKRVLVTGHTGFKGSWLALWLHRLGAEVTGIALPPATEPSLYALTVATQGIRSIEADIRDPAVLPAAIGETGPEVIFHLAAQALVRPSYRLPADTFSTNVMGTVNLLDAAREAADLQAVVIVTSDKCYENREWLWPYREDDALGGYDPYSASKGCAELVTASMRRSFFNHPDAPGVASARAGNVIGGGDWSEDRLVPDIVKAFLKREAPLIRNPAAVRPWQHVLEPLAGYLRLAECLSARPRDFSEAWNFGPDETGTSTVGDIADALARHWPEAPAWVRGTEPQPHEAHYLKVDSSKARARLSWQPRLSTPQTLDWTATWYAAFAAQDDPLAITCRQIDEYASRITEAPPLC